MSTKSRRARIETAVMTVGVYLYIAASTAIVVLVCLSILGVSR